MKITLCGSTKFPDEFREANLRLSKAGHIVYSVAAFMHSGDKLTVHEKTVLDQVHMGKIDNSDAIWLVHPDYIGNSTRNEIRYAKLNRKLIMIPRKKFLVVQDPQSGATILDSAVDMLAVHVCHKAACKDWAQRLPCTRCAGKKS